MLLKADAAQLEWRVKVFMSQDRVGMEEIANGLDLHTDNVKVFGLPSRLIAKIFIYRMIFADAFGDQGYDGPAYAYSKDADFMGTSSSKKFWKNVVERFFEKYEGVHEHSINLIKTATETGRIVNPSGRYYTFEPYQKWNGQWDWPRTDILNHPIQGLSADFMSLARRDIFNSIPLLGYADLALLINTVHDDVEMDVDNDPEIVYNCSINMIKAFRNIPQLFEREYGTKVNVPMDAEVKFGFTLYETPSGETPSPTDLIKFNPKTFEQDWKKYITRYAETNQC